MPDEGLFEKIERRMVRRRVARVGGVCAAVCCVAAVVLLWPRSEGEDVVAKEPQAEMTPTAPMATEPVAVEPVAAAVHAEASVREAEAVTVADAADEVEKTTTDEPVLRIDENDVAVVMAQQVTPKAMPLVDNAEQAVDGTESLQRVDSVDTARTAALPDDEDMGAPKAGQPVPHFDNVLWAPNMIIPDGEVDENRVFSIKTTSPITDFKLHIYNRNGRRIYLTTDPAFAWDATMNGARVPQGAYVWVATFRDTDGNPRQEQGTISVIR